MIISNSYLLRIDKYQIQTVNSNLIYRTITTKKNQNLRLSFQDLLILKNSIFG